MRLRLLSVAPLLLLSACAVGPDYAAPQWTFTGTWQALKGEENTPAAPAAIPASAPAPEISMVEWWQVFNDPVLNALLAQAEAGNAELKIAQARVLEARTLRTVAAASLYPEVNLGGVAQRGNRSNIFNEKPITLFEAAFDASWELDIFGGARREREAAEAEISAREAAQTGALLSLRAEVLRSYIELRGLQRQLEILRATTDALADTVQLTQSLTEAGLVNEANLARAQAQYLAQAAREPQLEAQIAAVKNQLAVLLGVQPQQISSTLEGAAPIPVALMQAVLDTPAQAIARRPDVLEAERALARETALTAAAIADMYPKITLSGALGMRNSSLAGSGPGWDIGAGLLQPIFNSGRIRANIDAADARATAALHAYEQVVLSALAEAETAIGNYLQAERHRAIMSESVAASQRAVDLASERYGRGISPYMDVLSAQDALYAAQAAQAEAEQALAVNLVALQKSLGR